MKSLERLSQRVTITTGIIFVVMMVALVLWSSWVFRKGLVVLEATSICAASVTAAAVDHDATAVRPFRVSVPDAELADLKQRRAGFRSRRRAL